MTTTLAESGLSARGGNKRLNLLLYGPPGTWKTVNAHQLPRTRTLDLDNGMQSVEWAIIEGVLDKKMSDIVFETILPPDSMDDRKNNVLQRCGDQVEEWLADEDIPVESWDKPYEQFWDTLVIDSASALTDASIVQGLKENDRLKLSRSYSQMHKGGVRPMKMQDWGAAAILFMKFINWTRGLGKNVVLIAHEYHNTDDQGSLISIDPKVIGQLRQDLPKDFDEVWYARIKGTKDKSKGVFQTKPDPRRHLRSRLGCLDADEDADFAEIKKKVAKFYSVPVDSLWTAAHGAEERAAAEAEALKGSAMV